MRVQVTVSVRAPDKLDTEDLANLLPHGHATVISIFGSQNVQNDQTGDTVGIATAMVKAFLPNQSANWRAL